MTQDEVDKQLQYRVDGRFALNTLMIRDLNPEQKLAYTMAQLVEAQKTVRDIMEISLIYAKEAVEFRKTPEYAVWKAKRG